MALADDLFQSIDTIISARIAKLPYDQTIECEIINADEASKGMYKIKYQNAYFDATSQCTTYQVGDRVYVQIPQNDYKQDKIILNKKNIQIATPVKALPFLSFAHDPYANLFSEVQRSRELILATTSDGKEVTSNIPMNLLINPIVGYTKLGLKFTASVDINSLMASGNYGIKIVIRGYDQTQIPYPQLYALDSSNLTTFEYFLKLEDMVGSNLYNTLGYCNQEKIFNIENIVIKSISAYLWHDGNFRTTDGVAVNNHIIKFTNFQLYPGYDIDEFKTNSTRIFLYTGDGLNYSTEYRTKTLAARMLTLTNGTDLVEENLASLTEKYAFYWERLESGKAEVSSISNLLGFNLLEDIDTDSALINIQLSNSRLSETQKYILTIRQKTGNEKYISNQLIFKNLAYLASSEVLNILTGFQATPAEENGYNGIYNIYGQDNYTTDQIITGKQHHLILSYNSIIADTNARGFQAGDTISWTIPGNYTMIREPRLGYDYYTDLEKPSIITDGEIIAGYKLSHIITQDDINTYGENFYVPYYIKEYYSPQNTNNIILCEFSRGTEYFSTTIELLFGTSGSQGSEYTIVPYLLKGTERVKAINWDEGSSVSYIIKFDIYDYNNNLIENKENIDYKISLMGDADKYSLGFNFNELTQSIKLEDFVSDLMSCYCCIKIEVEIGGKHIISYFPIPIAKNNKYKAINGSTVITYDITGKKPFYNKNKFSINIDDNSPHNINWQIGYIQEDGDQIIINNDSSELIAWPKIIDEELNLPSIFHHQLPTRRLALICSDNSSVIWVQPFIIIQNKYPIGLQHQEANPVEIENNIIIKNTMVGTVNQKYIDGNWDSDLSGVFMGIIGNENNADEDEFGLFGYHEGKKFFHLDKDGYVFLDGGNEAGVNINEAYITESTLEDINLIGTLNAAITSNFEIANGNGRKISILEPSGNLSINGNIQANTFNGNATDYDINNGLIAEHINKLKVAIQSLAEEANVEVNLW